MTDIDKTAIDEIIDPKLVEMLKRNYPEMYEQSVEDGASMSDLIAMIIVRMDQMLSEAQGIIAQAEAILDEHTKEVEA